MKKILMICLATWVLNDFNRFSSVTVMYGVESFLTKPLAMMDNIQITNTFQNYTSRLFMVNSSLFHFIDKDHQTISPTSTKPIHLFTPTVA